MLCRGFFESGQVRPGPCDVEVFSLRFNPAVPRLLRTSPPQEDDNGGSVVTKLSREASAAAAFDGLGADSDPPKLAFVMPLLQLHGNGMFHISLSILGGVLYLSSMRFQGHVCLRWILGLSQAHPLFG
jgi:hypothetical protein